MRSVRREVRVLPCQFVVRIRQTDADAARLRLQALNVRLQLPASVDIESFELYTDVKEVLRKTFRVNNPGTGLDRGYAFTVSWQLELDVNLDIHDQADGSLTIRDELVDDILGTAEFQPANRDIKYLYSGQPATRLSHFAGQIRMNTMVLSIAAKMLLRICVRNHVSCTRPLIRHPCGPVANLLCLFTDLKKRQHRLQPDKGQVHSPDDPVCRMIHSLT